MYSTLSIFAGLDANDAIRFVGDVPRGAACGCRCEACGAALVARRGDIRTWHFAHEASQERPDCFVGAVNLLRRLAIQRLQDAPLFDLPIFSTEVVTRTPLPRFVECVEWPPGAVRLERWETSFPRHGSVALLRLDSGTAVRLFVEIEEASSPRPRLELANDGGVVYWVPLPAVVSELKDRIAALRHIDSFGHFAWINLPDANARVAETLTRLEEKARRVRDETLALRRMSGSLPPDAEQPTAPYTPAPPREEFDGSPWVLWRKPSHAFIFYGMKDGSAWVLFPHKDGRMFMAPWPTCEDGWDERLPMRIGTPISELGAYALTDRLQTMVYLSPQSKSIRTASTWKELQEIKWPLAA